MAEQRPNPGSNSKDSPSRTGAEDPGGTWECMMRRCLVAKRSRVNELWSEW